MCLVAVHSTVENFSAGTDMSEKPVQTQIRLLLLFTYMYLLCPREKFILYEPLEAFMENSRKPNESKANLLTIPL